MATINDIIEQQNRQPYKWGEHDCITTIQALFKEQTGKTFARPAGWSGGEGGISETAAIRKAIKRHGSVGQAYADYFRKRRVKVVYAAAAAQMRPGDVCWLEGTPVLNGKVIDTSTGVSVIAFPDQSYTLLAWSNAGFVRVTGYYYIKAVFLCPKR